VPGETTLALPVGVNDEAFFSLDELCPQDVRLAADPAVLDVLLCLAR